MAKVTVNYSGTKRYYGDCSMWHREDGPAIIYKNGSSRWYKNNLLHREDGPAVSEATGEKQWLINNKYLYRSGPTKDWPNGFKIWKTGMVMVWPKL